MNSIYYVTETPVKEVRKDSTDLSTGGSQQNINDKIIYTGQVVERSCEAKANNFYCSTQMQRKGKRFVMCNLVLSCASL